MALHDVTVFCMSTSSLQGQVAVLKLCDVQTRGVPLLDKWIMPGAQLAEHLAENTIVSNHRRTVTSRYAAWLNLLQFAWN